MFSLHRDYRLVLRTEDGGNNWNSDQNADISFYFSSESPLDIAEDLNRDGKVDVLDLQLCVNVYLGVETDPTVVERADVNEDDVVDISDVEQVIGRFMGR